MQVTKRIMDSLLYSVDSCNHRGFDNRRRRDSLVGRNLCSEYTRLVGQAQKDEAGMYVRVTVSRGTAHHKLDRDSQKAASLCELDMSTASDRIRD